jgi:plasmid replication initiation protein
MSRKPSSRVVATSNRITEACYHLTLAEKRVILAVLSQIDSRAEAPPERQYLIRVEPFADLFKLERDNAYKVMREGAERLAERWLWVSPEPTISPFIDQNKIRWVEQIGYGKTKGIIQVMLTTSIMPYITALSREFTQYRIQHIVGLPTPYSLRIYELLVQFRSAGEREVEIKWLRERLMLVDKYPSVKDLKRYVIDPAVKQINTHTDLWVKYQQRKSGRNVVALIFTFGTKTPPEAPEKPVAAPETKPAPSGRLSIMERKAFVQKHAHPGESWEAAYNRLLTPDGAIRRRE